MPGSLVPDVTIRFQDQHLMVVEKPTLLPSVPGKKKDSLITRLQILWPSATIVHRLDVDTSGLMLVALSPEAQRKLSAAFRARLIAKSYLALCHGVPKQRAGLVNLPLRCDWPNRPLQMVDHVHGKPAQTTYRVFKTNGKHSYFYLKLHTGRSHQLRVHLKEIGHPILGDPYYSPPHVVQMATRLCLHACRLKFVHPMTQQRFCFHSGIDLSTYLA